MIPISLRLVARPPSYVACALFVTACSGEAPDIRSTAQRVELDYAGTSYQVNLAPTGAIASAQRAEGTLFVPILDGNHDQKFSHGVPLRATCGVTFISRTMAITASHCVRSPNVYDLDNQTFTVQMYRPTANLAWSNATSLSGTFPDTTHTALTSGMGYHTEPFTCRVVKRCGEDWGHAVQLPLGERDRRRHGRAPVQRRARVPLRPPRRGDGRERPRVEHARRSRLGARGLSPRHRRRAPALHGARRLAERAGAEPPLLRVRA